jgi:DNA recombination protein RmuC
MDILFFLLGLLTGAVTLFIIFNKKVETEKKRQHELELELSQIKATMTEKESSFKSQIALLNDTKEKLKIEFEHLGQKIFEQNSDKLKKESKASIDEVMNPMKEQLKDFKDQIQKIHLDETKERSALKQGISDLKELNMNLSIEAQNLSKALTNDKKLQGDWGETILERVLEQSGLTKDREYFIQNSFRNENDQLQRPDVIIKLPDGKDIIIDSKVSLVDFKKYYEATEEDEQAKHLKGHIQAIETHIKTLSDKKYHDLNDLNTLDFVFLFIPIENAFFAALNNKNDLYQLAYDKNIILVCPTTLHLTLRMVKDLWRKDSISKEAQNISEKAGKMYDKFHNFLDKFVKVGNALKSSEKHYTDAFNQLAKGPANLIKSSQELLDMGIKTNKTIEEIEKPKLSESEQDKFDETLSFKLED